MKNYIVEFVDGDTETFETKEEAVQVLKNEIDFVVNIWSSQRESYKRMMKGETRYVSIDSIDVETGENGVVGYSTSISEIACLLILENRSNEIADDLDFLDDDDDFKEIVDDGISDIKYYLQKHDRNIFVEHQLKELETAIEQCSTKEEAIAVLEHFEDLHALYINFVFNEIDECAQEDF